MADQVHPEHVVRRGHRGKRDAHVLLLVGAKQSYLHDITDGMGSDSANDVLPERHPFHGDSHNPIALPNACLVRRGGPDDAPDPHALPEPIGVHGDPQPRPGGGWLGSSVRRKTDQERRWRDPDERGEHKP